MVHLLMMFTLAAEADRVLYQFVMFLTVFYHWMYKMKFSCYQESSNEMRFTNRKTLFTERIPLLSIRSIRTDRHMAYTDRYGAGVLDNPR